jgi:hypothetical protein
VRAEKLRSGMDSDLEAFSHNPADGSFAVMHELIQESDCVKLSVAKLRECNRNRPIEVDAK